jgi:hypothetical protein
VGFRVFFFPFSFWKLQDTFGWAFFVWEFLHPLVLYIRSGHEGMVVYGQKSMPHEHGVFDVVEFWS